MFEFLKKKFKDPINEGVKLLCKDMIDNSENWEQTEHTYDKKDTELRIWTANGINYIDFYPKLESFNKDEQMFILESIKTSRIRNAITDPEVKKTITFEKPLNKYQMIEND